jgi:hypothetical protein
MAKGNLVESGGDAPYWIYLTYLTERIGFEKERNNGERVAAKLTKGERSATVVVSIATLKER